MEPPPVQYIQTRDGQSIAFCIAGQGPTLVRTQNLWNHVSRLWSKDLLGPYFDALAERFRLVQYDARGQGLSTRPLLESLKFEDYSTDLDAVVSRTCDERFTLMGWSLSGSVAIRYALDHPERVSALILCDYADMGRSETSANMMELARRDWHLFVETTARIGYPDLPAARVKEVLYDAMSQSDHIRQGQAFMSLSGEDMLGDIKVPTLFLATRRGGRPLSNEALATRWAAALPNARLALFEGEEGPWSSKAVEVVAEFVKDVISNEQTLGEGAAQDSWPTTRLTPREREVLRLIACGKSNQQIADELVLSVRTVERHITNLYEKIGAHGKASATAYALRHRLA
jgi:pimeloyl-ACP methyl ester carboxylesterase/DNA-binding CsgD family transcriptional regulator